MCHQLIGKPQILSLTRRCDSVYSSGSGLEYVKAAPYLETIRGHFRCSKKKNCLIFVSLHPHRESKREQSSQWARTHLAKEKKRLYSVVRDVARICRTMDFFCPSRYLSRSEMGGHNTAPGQSSVCDVWLARHLPPSDGKKQTVTVFRLYADVSRGFRYYNTRRTARRRRSSLPCATRHTCFCVFHSKDK